MELKNIIDIETVHMEPTSLLFERKIRRTLNAETIRIQRMAQAIHPQNMKYPKTHN